MSKILEAVQSAFKDHTDLTELVKVMEFVAELEGMIKIPEEAKVTCEPGGFLRHTGIDICNKYAPRFGIHIQSDFSEMMVDLEMGYGKEQKRSPLIDFTYPATAAGEVAHYYEKFKAFDKISKSE